MKHAPWPLACTLLAAACSAEDTGSDAATDAAVDALPSVPMVGALCPDVRELASPDVRLGLGFTVGQVLSFTAGAREAPFDWYRRDGFALPNTRVTLDLSDTATFVVRGSAAPETGDAAWTCREHVVVTGSAHFRTDDGQFEERLPVVLRSVDGRYAAGIVSLAAADLAGRYTPPLADTECLVRLDFSFEMRPESFTGEFTQQVALASCDQVTDGTPITIRSGGWWGDKSFQKPPTDAGRGDSSD